MSTLKPSDEFRHAPLPKGENWQENYVWHAWDSERNSGWYIHLGNIHDQGFIDVRVIVIIDGVATSTVAQGPGDDCLGAPGLETTVVTPLEHMKLRYAGRGGQGPSSEGVLGQTPGEVPFGFDVEMISEHPAVDWGPYLAKLGMDPLIAGEHYEQGARWRGKLWAGDREIEAEGLLVRDHSWGKRIWRNFWPMWIPMVFDGGKRFISGLCAADDNIWKTFSVLTDQNGFVNDTFDNWISIVGPHVPRQWDKMLVLRNGKDFAERYEYEGRYHITFERHASFVDNKGSPVRRALSDMYSVIRGEGHVGFGTFQSFTTPAIIQQGYDNPLPRFA